MTVLLHRDMGVVVDILDLRNLNMLLHDLQCWHMALLGHRHVHNFIDILDLRYLHRLLHHFLHGNLLLHNLRHVRNLLLNYRLLALHGPRDYLGLLHFNSLHLMLHNSVNHGLCDFWHLDDLLLNLDLWNFDRLLDDLRPWNLHHHLHGILHNLLLVLNDRNMD